MHTQESFIIVWDWWWSEWALSRSNSMIRTKNEICNKFKVLKPIASTQRMLKKTTQPKLSYSFISQRLRLRFSLLPQFTKWMIMLSIRHIQHIRVHLLYGSCLAFSSKFATLIVNGCVRFRCSHISFTFNYDIVIQGIWSSYELRYDERFCWNENKLQFD